MQQATEGSESNSAGQKAAQWKSAYRNFHRDGKFYNEGMATGPFIYDDKNYCGCAEDWLPTARKVFVSRIIPQG